jgi:hypothetical protein
MPIRYVIDECLRDEMLFRILKSLENPIDVVRVGDIPELPIGIKDEDLLQWASRSGRIVVTADHNSMPGHLAECVASGGNNPGVLIVRRAANFHEVAEWLEIFTTCPEDAQGLANSFWFIP